MASITGTEGSNFLFGTAGDDVISGLGGNDSLFGQGGNDTLDGGEGDDKLFGRGGSDTMTGGFGADTFSLSVSAGDSTAASTDTITDFEGAGALGGDILDLTNPPGNRRFVFEGQLAAMPAIGATLAFGGNGFTEVFFALDGTDTLLFADSNDNGVYDESDFTVRLTGHHTLTQDDFSATTGFVIRGTDKKDTIVGDESNNVIFGLRGNDIISGAGGNDTIDGGHGSDILNGDTGNDRIEGRDGDDVIDGGDGNDVLAGGNGADTIGGGAGNDQIQGGAGDDILEGGDGRDRLAGGDGNDHLSGGADNDDFDGNDGDDVMYGGAGADDFFGGRGDDEIYGEDGDDEIFADEGDDVLSGGAGADELWGYDGADQIEGGTGNDLLGFRLRTDSPLAAHDTVLDFEGAGAAGGDQIEIANSLLVFGGQVSVDPTPGAILSGGGNGLTEIVYTVRDGETWLLSDVNDNGVLDNSDFAVKFIGEHAFTEADFDEQFVIAGTENSDTISGTEDDDVTYGLGGDDRVFGFGGDDEIHGGEGNDFIDGGTGFDTLFGEGGNDTLSLQNSDFGGSAFGGAGNDVLIGSDEGFFSDLHGEEGNDTLQAGASGSSMFGGDDDDILIGSAETDQFAGGAGKDLFVFQEIWSQSTTFGDRISDFDDGVEKIDLRQSALSFEDLTIENIVVSEFFSIARISHADAGLIEVQGDFDENFQSHVHIDSSDFLFA